MESGKFDEEQNTLMGSTIVESSKKFITDGRVTPDIFQVTKDLKRAKGSPTPDIPLMDTGDLVRSLKATKKGIMGKAYGRKHLEGDGVLTRNFIHIEEPKIKKTLNTLINKMNRIMKK